MRPPRRRLCLREARFVIEPACRRAGAGATTTLDVYDPSYGTVPTLPRGATSITLNNQKQNQLGLYVQDQARLGNWILTLTGRQDWASSDTQQSAKTSCASRTTARPEAES